MLPFKCLPQPKDIYIFCLYVWCYKYEFIETHIKLYMGEGERDVVEIFQKNRKCQCPMGISTCLCPLTVSVMELSQAHAHAIIFLNIIFSMHILLYRVKL